MKAYKSYHNNKQKPRKAKNGFNNKSRPTQQKSGRFNSPLPKLQKQFKDRSRKDIETWRRALEAAEMPEDANRSALIDLYDEIDLDLHLTAQVQLRKASTIARKFLILNAKGEKDEDATKLFEKDFFGAFVSEALKTIFWGGRVLELANTHSIDELEIVCIPQKLTQLEDERMYLDSQRLEYVEYKKPQFIDRVIEIEGEYGLGLYNKLAPHVLWKRNAFQAWAEYDDLFGVPFRSATSNSRDSKELNLIETMLEQMGSAGYGIFPQGTEIDIKEMKSADAYRVFDKMIERNNSEISKAVNTVTMLSDNGSSKSQSEVHFDVQKQLMKADGNFIKRIVNKELIPKLQKAGLLPEGIVFDWDESKTLPLTEQWKIVEKLLDTHDIDEDWISKTFNIPIIGRREQPAPTFSKGQGEQAPVARLALEMNLPTDYIKDCCGGFRASGDNRDQVIKSLEKELLNATYDNEGVDKAKTEYALLIAKRLFKRLMQGWGDRFKRIDLDYESPDLAALQAMEMNIFHFSMTKSEAAVLELNKLLTEDGKVLSFEDFSQKAQPLLTNFNRHWLKTEYNKSVAVGQSVSSYFSFFDPDEKQAYPYVQYQTVGDSHVRQEHQELDGMIFRKEDKSWRKFLPPNGHNCRCEIVTYTGGIPSKVNTGDDAIGAMGESFEFMQKQGFYMNFADRKEVFAKNQLYLKNWDIASHVNKLNSSTYDLKSLNRIRHEREAIPFADVAKEDIPKLFKPEKDLDYMVFKDYQGRALKLKESVFKKHTKGKYLAPEQRRHELFHLVSDTLKNADEVYLHQYNDKKLFNYRFIKFYQDRTMVVDSFFDAQNGLQLETWYGSDNNRIKVDTDIRKGILIKGGIKK